jgi:hypothetical protein
LWGCGTPTRPPILKWSCQFTLTGLPWGLTKVKR